MQPCISSYLWVKVYFVSSILLIFPDFFVGNVLKVKQCLAIVEIRDYGTCRSYRAYQSDKTITDTRVKEVTNVRWKTYCLSLNTTGRIRIDSMNKSFTNKKNVTCKGRNVGYCSQCQTCGRQHAGQTKRTIHEWLKEHFRNVRNATADDPNTSIRMPIIAK